jgi:hypothetical protein
MANDQDLLIGLGILLLIGISMGGGDGSSDTTSPMETADDDRSGGGRPVFRGAGRVGGGAKRRRTEPDQDPPDDDPDTPMTPVPKKPAESSTPSQQEPPAKVGPSTQDLLAISESKRLLALYTSLAAEGAALARRVSAAERDSGVFGKLTVDAISDLARKLREFMAAIEKYKVQFRIHDMSTGGAILNQEVGHAQQLLDYLDLLLATSSRRKEEGRERAIAAQIETLKAFLVKTIAAEFDELSFGQDQSRNACRTSCQIMLSYNNPP